MLPHAHPSTIVYPNFPLAVRRGDSFHALSRTASWIGVVIGKITLVVALAAVLGTLAGSTMGFFVVIAMI
jgi:hypothetical protein